jgi:hypothetical protein
MNLVCCALSSLLIITVFSATGAKNRRQNPWKFYSGSGQSPQSSPTVSRDLSFSSITWFRLCEEWARKTKTPRLFKKHAVDSECKIRQTTRTDEYFCVLFEGIPTVRTRSAKPTNVGYNPERRQKEPEIEINNFIA